MRQLFTPYPSYHEFWNSVTTRVLEYPPFNEVIHWDRETESTVVLEQPEILESYILMPVFGIPTLSTFKRRLYVRSPATGSYSGTDLRLRQMSGFDSASERFPGGHPGPPSPAWGTHPIQHPDNDVGLTLRKQCTSL